MELTTTLNADIIKETYHTPADCISHEYDRVHVRSPGLKFLLPRRDRRQRYDN